LSNLDDPVFDLKSLLKVTLLAMSYEKIFKFKFTTKK